MQAVSVVKGEALLRDLPGFLECTPNTPLCRERSWAVVGMADFPACWVFCESQRFGPDSWVPSFFIL